MFHLSGFPANTYTDLLIQMGHSDDDVNNRLKRLAPEFFDIDG